MQNVYVVVNKETGKPAVQNATMSRQAARDLKNLIASRNGIDTRTMKIMKYAPVGSVR